MGMLMEVNDTWSHCLKTTRTPEQLSKDFSKRIKQVNRFIKFLNGDSIWFGQEEKLAIAIAHIFGVPAITPVIKEIAAIAETKKEVEQSVILRIFRDIIVKKKTTMISEDDMKVLYKLINKLFE